MKMTRICVALLCCCFTACLSRAATTEEALCMREPEPVPGVKGQALNFITSDPGMFNNASTAYFQNAPRPFIGGPSGTVALWFKAEWPTGTHSVLMALGSHRDGVRDDCEGVIPRKAGGTGEGFEVVVKPEKASASGRVAAWTTLGGRGFALDAPALVDLKNWHHVAMVWRPGDAWLFLDGKLAANAKTGLDNDFELLRHFQLSSDMYNGHGFNGALDEVLAFSRALSAAEIAELAKGKDLTGDAALAFYLPCDGDATAKVERRELSALLADKMCFRAALGKSRFAASGEPIPMALSIPPGAPEDFGFNLSISADNGAAAPVFHAAGSLRRDANRPMEKDFSTTLARCGVYRMALEVKDAKGKKVFGREVTFCVIAKLPPLAEVPDSSPCGASDVERMDLGAKWIRLFDAAAWGWSSLEPRKGRFHWDYLDATVAEVRGKGGQVLLCVVGTPKWASSMPPAKAAQDKHGFPSPPGAGWLGAASYPPANMADFENFLRELFRRYKGKIAAYECWNEPDTSHFNGSAAQYVDMLRTMRRALSEEDPGALLVGGVGSGYLGWTNRIMPLDAAPLMDVLAIHPYCYAAVPVAEYRQGQLGQLIAALRTTEAKLGHALPVWSDEFGTVFSPLNKEAFVKKYGAETTSSAGVLMTYKEQSVRWDIQTALASLSIGDGGKYFWHGTNNLHYDDKSVACAALAKAVSFRKTTRPIAVNDHSLGVLFETVEPSSWLLPFFGGAKHTAALFGSGAAVFPLAAAEVEGMDMYGNPLRFATEDGLLKLNLTDDVVYLLDVPADFEGMQVVSAKLPEKSDANARIVGELTLFNPYKHQESFRLTAKAPAGWEVELPGAALTLGPNAKASAPLKLRSGPTTGDVDIELAAVDSKGNAFPIQRRLYNLAILPMPRFAQGSDIPGPLAKVDALNHVCFGQLNPQFPEMPHWNGPDDLSYEVRGGWREDGLHLWIEVVDDKLHPGSADAPWNKDAVELFVDFDSGTKITGTRLRTEQIAIVPSLGKEFAPCEVKHVNGGNYGKAKFQGRRTERGYVVAGTLSFYNLRPGLYVGLDVKVDDCDAPAANDARKSSMAWNGDELDCASSAKWGRFVLAP